MTMPASSERPIAAAERRALSMRLATPERDGKRSTRRLLVGLPFFFLGLSGLTVLASDISATIVLSFWFVATVGLGLWVGIAASAVIDFEEEEDEGACYAFQIAGDRILFISGQQFYPSAKFPCSDFALIDVVGPSGELVDFFIRKDGSKLVPIRTVPAQAKRRLRLGAHLHVMTGKLTELEQLLGAGEGR